jgi:pimeloyl-ACP methyl ester carboxylesterase
VNLSVALATAVAAVLAQAGSPPTAVSEVAWQPCSLSDTDTERTAECAMVQMPLDHDGDSVDNGTIGIAVKRILSSNTAPARTHLWFLDGGPGDSGIHSLPKVHSLLGDAGVDIYTLDHRGVGQSAKLGCPDQEAADSPGAAEVLQEEWGGCTEYLLGARPDLPYLTTTQAAKDVAALIAATSRPQDRTIVFGASYGTYWAQRYLEVFPEQADAVILDGLVPPGWTFAGFDANIDVTARRVMAACADMPECMQQLGPDPVAVLAELPDRIDGGHCPDLQIDGATIRLLFGNMLMAGQDIWPFIPPMVQRLNQCRLRDLLAIGELFEQLFEERGAATEDPSHSPVLQRHVALSELWPDPAPDPEELETALQGMLMTTAVSAHFARTWEDWPRYPRPADLAPSSYDGPALLLHGELDPTMPYELLPPLTDQFNTPGQQFVLVPGVGHVTLGKSDCANDIYKQFLANPGGELDTSCVATLVSEPLVMPADAPLLFGTDDLWGERMSDLEIMLYLAAAAVLLLIVGAVWFWRRRRRAARAA